MDRVRGGGWDDVDVGVAVGQVEVVVVVVVDVAGVGAPGRRNDDRGRL